MRELLGRLQSITERARTSSDPGDADALSQELSTLVVDLAVLGYERHSSYEQFAPVQLACENARDAVEALRAKPRVDTAVPRAAAERAA